MLFNSYLFIFAFLPVVYVVYYALRAHHPRQAIAWLTVSSLFFYSWWNPPFVALLSGSILINFQLAYWIDRHHGSTRAKLWLAIGLLRACYALLLPPYLFSPCFALVSRTRRCKASPVSIHTAAKHGGNGVCIDNKST